MISWSINLTSNLNQKWKQYGGVEKMRLHHGIINFDQNVSRSNCNDMCRWNCNLEFIPCIIENIDSCGQVVSQNKIILR